MGEWGKESEGGQMCERRAGEAEGCGGKVKD